MLRVKTVQRELKELPINRSIFKFNFPKPVNVGSINTFCCIYVFFTTAFNSQLLPLPRVTEMMISLAFALSVI